MPVTPSPQVILNVMENKVKEDGKTMSLCFTILNWWLFNWKAVLTELLSTCLLVLLGCMSCIPAVGFSPQPPLYGSLGFGLTVLMLIQCFGHISGAHMNPSVTLAAVIWGGTSLFLGIMYVAAQCVGAVFGYYILMKLSPVDLIDDGICVTKPREGLNEVQTFGVELFLTASLIYLCCALWDPINEKKQDSAAVKFGLAITGLSNIGGPITGASMNPARSLGPAFWTGIWIMHWVYWLAPLVGSFLAVLSYKFVFMISTEKKPKEETVTSS